MASYDTIIVGAGSSGCVLAARLSEEPSRQVLLIEAGGPDANPDIHIPANAWKVWATENDWFYPTVPQPDAAGRSLAIPRGKMLGGSSSLNAMIYIRGNAADYDHWAYLGNAGWDYESVLPYFRRSEDYHGGANRYHGAGGPLTVSKVTHPNPLTDAFLAAGQSIGLARNDDFAGASPFGIGYCDLTVRDGRRWSTAAAFLRPAMNRPNLTVVTHAAAQKLVVDNGRCTGIDYLVDGKLVQAHASGEVVLSAGAIASPRLLLLSGIGPAQELRKLGIEVVADLPGVGKNLQDHLLSFVIHEAAQPIAAPHHNMLEAHFFDRSDSRLLGPDHQPLFMTNAPPLPTLDIPPNSYALAPGLIRPQSRGEIRLVSANPAEPALLDPRYLSEPADLDCLIHSLEQSRELMNAPAFAGLSKREVWPGPKDRAGLKDYARRTCETYHHHAGTCRMGLDSMSVVDPALKVYGIEGLRVVDASIMPDVVSGNTNAPSIMIAEKAADLMRGVPAALKTDPV